MKNPHKFTISVKIVSDELGLEEVFSIDEEAEKEYWLKWQPNRFGKQYFSIHISVLNSSLRYFVECVGECVERINSILNFEQTPKLPLIKEVKFEQKNPDRVEYNIDSPSLSVKQSSAFKTPRKNSIFASSESVTKSQFSKNVKLTSTLRKSVYGSNYLNNESIKSSPIPITRDHNQSMKPNKQQQQVDKELRSKFKKLDLNEIFEISKQLCKEVQLLNKKADDFVRDLMNQKRVLDAKLAQMV